MSNEGAENKVPENNQPDHEKGKFDMTGVFDVQKKYLTDLSDSYPDVNNAPLVAKYVLGLQDKIQDTAESYKKADTSAANVLTEQDKVMNIVDEETKRLEKKKFLIEQAESEERRKALLAESQALRKTEYTKILLVLVTCVFIHIVLALIAKHAFTEPMESSTFAIFSLLHIFNFAVWTLLALYIYIQMQSRSQINFNKLELPPPHLVDGSSSSPEVADYNNLLRDLGFCYGEECCGEDTVWDETAGKCMKVNSSSPAKEGFDNPTDYPVATTLNTLPQFEYEGLVSKDEKKSEEKPAFDGATASLDDVKEKTDNDVSTMMSAAFSRVSEQVSSLANVMNQQKESNDGVEEKVGQEMEQTTTALLEDAIPGGSNSKCHFTTLAHSSANREVYLPQEQSALLPKSEVLDGSIYSCGVNEQEVSSKFAPYK